MIRSSAGLVAVAAAMLACARGSRPEGAAETDARHEATATRESAVADAASSTELPSRPPSADAGLVPPPASDGGKATAVDRRTAAGSKVEVVTIGMHVAGGPFDEATKVPFQKAVEPRFAEMTACFAENVPAPPKRTDVGVDLMIEAAGGMPRVSNPRTTLPKMESEALVQCVVGVFASVSFPRLERGKTGVSYSLRFTTR